MMSVPLSKKLSIKRILVVSMTNIGDVVLSCPVIDILRQDFPQAQIDVVVGKKLVSLFADNPYVRIKVFDKQAPLRQKYVWFLDLYRTRYDVVVDLRRTLLAWLLRPRYATPVLPVSLRDLFPVSLRAKRSNLLKEIASSLKNAPRNDTIREHKKDIHLNRLRQVYDYDAPASKQYAIINTKEDEHFFDTKLLPALQKCSFVVIAPGAADSAKRWHPQGFAAVADYLSGMHQVLFVGDVQDTLLIEDIQRMMKTPSVSLAGKMNLRQLAFILKKSSWVLSHDSGVMHLACYFNVPVVALWGPTSLEKYAPWGDPKKSVIVRRNEKCVRCSDPKSALPHNCMSSIEVEDVLNAVKTIQR